MGQRAIGTTSLAPQSILAAPAKQADSLEMHIEQMETSGEGNFERGPEAQQSSKAARPPSLNRFPAA